MNSQLTKLKISNADAPRAGELRTKIDAVLKEVSDCIAPVWPLKDYVAVNPYFGLVDRSFMSARAFLRVFSECEMLMPLAYYAAQWRAGQLDAVDLEQALDEITWPKTIEPLSADQIFEMLAQTEGDESPELASQHRRSRPVMCMVERASAISKINWQEIVVDEISKYCAAHFDDGQASWSSPWKSRPLYTAWREQAQIDRNVEVLGLTGMRRLVASLPEDPQAAIIELLCRMNVPFPLWSTVLLSQVFSIPGWSAWAKYQDDQQTSECQPQTLCGLLAIRLAYDFAVGLAVGFEVDWNSYMRNGYASFQSEDSGTLVNAWSRYALLRAMEIRYRRQLLNSLSAEPAVSSQLESVSSTKSSTTAQMVFCIDVRSERIRRHIETTASSVDTFGFAGFFGLPIDYQSLGEVTATNQLPVLLKPTWRVHECLAGSSDSEQSQVIDRRIQVRSWRKLWQSFKSSSIGSFGFVESSGLWAGLHLIRQVLGYGAGADHQRDGLSSQSQKLRPDVCEKASHSLTTAQQVDLAARVLSNLGLTKDFARLVTFCGHLSQTNNNPLAAGLDCGACGGHSGAPNARWLALVLNKTDVRLGLCERGIIIPPSTYFLAATHNTTTDVIEFFDVEDMPHSHHHDYDALQATCRQAAKAAAQERVPQLGIKHAADVYRRAADWSEVRPEWGLAGNAAMVVGPRSLTSRVDLKGSVFLHSYDATQDTNGSVLETIMTAPMVVANWINMQYYASTVDNCRFGSGSKAIHNVVGKFGILAGNSGDLKTGLPLQSLHDGTSFRHQPQRLLVLICAPKASIDRVYQKHELVANLVNNQWLSIVAIEGADYFLLSDNGRWQSLDVG